MIGLWNRFTAFMNERLSFNRWQLSFGLAVLWFFVISGVEAVFEMNAKRLIARAVSAGFFSGVVSTVLRATQRQPNS